MFRVTAAVNDGGDAVFIDAGDGPVFYRDFVGVDADAVLCEVLEYVYGDCDFDYVFCGRGVGWRIYEVEVIDDVEW